LFLLPSLIQEAPTIVTYKAKVPEEVNEPRQKMQTKIQRKPARASSQINKVIVANTLAPMSIQVPDVEVTAPSLEFGTGNDFGDAWGSGDGFKGGGEVSFFNQKAKAERIAYVIDFSQSMRGERDKLMRKEMNDSVSKLPDGVQYQMIFFAGPAWVAGDEVKLAGNKTAVVTDGGRKYEWLTKGGAHDWETKGKERKAEWLDAGGSQRRKSIKQIEETALVWGTTWEPALEMAFNMEPPPQIIFFMTDGVTGGKMDDITRRIASRARSKDIVINTVAMMEPRAMASMKEIAKKTGGQFTIIEKDGKARQVPTD